jgi:hypothetical protein
MFLCSKCEFILWVLFSITGDDDGCGRAVWIGLEETKASAEEFVHC